MNFILFAVEASSGRAHCEIIGFGIDIHRQTQDRLKHLGFNLFNFGYRRLRGDRFELAIGPVLIRCHHQFQPPIRRMSIKLKGALERLDLSFSQRIRALVVLAPRNEVVNLYADSVPDRMQDANHFLLRRAGKSAVAYQRLHVCKNKQLAGEPTQCIEKFVAGILELTRSVRTASAGLITQSDMCFD